MILRTGILTFSLFISFFLTSVNLYGAAKTYTNSIDIEFVLIPSGTFMMGCNKNLEKCNEDEIPQHKVTISKPFYMGKYEVTQEQWVKLMGVNPSIIYARNNPVEEVSWYDVQEFIKKLNTKKFTIMVIIM